MHLPKELTTVTPVSKAVALILFISLPIMAFLFGMRYQTMLTEQDKTVFFMPTTISPTPKSITCTEDTKICPDGSVVGRVSPRCKFDTCPNNDAFCGGIAGKLCPSGYYCKYEGTYPDASGTCIKDKITNKFICPKNGWVNCMPILNKEAKQACSKEAIEWYKVNCSNFKGAAY